MITHDIRKLERTLEEYGVDFETRAAIVEASINHNHAQLLQRFENTLKKYLLHLSSSLSYHNRDVKVDSLSSNPVQTRFRSYIPIKKPYRSIWTILKRSSCIAH